MKLGVVLLLLFAYLVLSVPIRCAEVSINTLEEEDTFELDDDLNIMSIDKKCENSDTCAFHLTNMKEIEICVNCSDTEYYYNMDYCAGCCRFLCNGCIDAENIIIDKDNDFCSLCKKKNKEENDSSSDCDDN
eukprot:gene11331-4143_t